jgi:hypothetical protein
MQLVFPSREFDDAVAAVCQADASDEQVRALNELLLADLSARDEYLVRVELHARLGSDPRLYASALVGAANPPAEYLQSTGMSTIVPLPRPPFRRNQVVTWTIGLAACLAILAAVWTDWFRPKNVRKSSSSAVAVLSQAVAPHWSSGADSHLIGAPLEPGWLRLKSGSVQVTFYRGGRLMIQGPAEVQLVSPGAAFCRAGRVVAVVPPQSRGFRMETPQVKVTDLGTEFGLAVTHDSAEVHVFKGEVEWQPETASTQRLKEGKAVQVDTNGAAKEISADPTAFASLYDLERKWLATVAQRYRNWQIASARLNQDRSLLVHFDFDEPATSGWTLHNASAADGRAPDGTVVGCQATEGRWHGKRALEFRNLNDRVLLGLPGEFQALTLSAWVNVKGLDRQFNSLLMCDGFTPGTVHWQIRNDGVLDLGVQGLRPRDVQIFASPPVIGFDQFGQWVHLATVIDGRRKKLTHYVNGLAVSQEDLKHPPPYRIGAAELGNWNPGEMPRKPPFLIRNFSGTMDEFALFTRALSNAEIQTLYAEGNPYPDL